MFLLSQDADVGLTDDWRNTALHYVTSELLKVSGFVECVTNILTNKHVYMFIRNAVGMSAVQHSIAHAHGLLDLFHDTRSSDNIKQMYMYVDCHGNTPLHHAVGIYNKLKKFYISNHFSKTVDFLVKHGADINAQNNAGLTPLHVAQGHEAIKACLRHADDRSFTITDKQGRNFWHLLFLLRDVVTMTTDTLHMLPASNAVYCKDHLRRTPLHHICIRENYSMLSNRFTENFITILNAKLIINKKDKFKRTALHYAAIVGILELMYILEMNKADR